MREDHPEVWGGVECTVRRVGDEFADQVERSGHAERVEDLDRFAGLGIRAIRYPVLWERVAPESLERADWSWSDARLARLRELGVRPIVGLLHHGSGPRSTSLIDPAFPEKLAEYAGAVARRYPWVRQFTPVNEPLTTARFSGLYGHWYPHGRDPQTFVRAVLNQCRGIALAMRAIREVIPEAELVQTEDLAKVHAPPVLAYQAEFENRRRWLSLDLLCGRVDGSSAMGRWLREAGAEPGELEWFGRHPCPPQVLGFNYYITSERYLDPRLELYPPSYHGGNGRHRYADVEAVRVLPEGPDGVEGLLREAWQRYGLPLALSEVHLGCHRESQLQWLAEAWQSVRRLRGAGVDVRAITAWSLLGAFDWDSLLTRNDGHYEPGVFDLRGPVPRPTALARLIVQLSAGEEPSHPVLAGRGWWRRPERILYAAPADEGRRFCAPPPATPREAAPLVITGATGTLGRAFARICAERGLAYAVLSRREMDIVDPASVAEALCRYRPWAVVNAAGYVRVDDAEQDQDRCFRENTEGAAVVARETAARGVGLLTFSSDLVFDGARRSPYLESHRPQPLSCYGRSKALAEERIAREHPGALVIRTSAFFGPWDDHNFLTVALRHLQQRRPFAASDDTVVSPTYVPDLVHACLDLLVDGESGLWHLANGGAVTWWEFACRAAELARVPRDHLVARPERHFDRLARRPPYSALGSERGMCLPALDSALERYAGHVPALLAS